MIRYNQRPRLPWNLVENGEIIRLNDEDFFTRIRDLACLDLETNRTDRLREIYISLEILKEQQGRFYVRNNQEIDSLKNYIGSFIGLGPLANQCHAFCFCKNKQ